MQIKAFSANYKVPADTIRYYEKEGLLQPKRLENGYRLYDESCANQLKLIIVLKHLGFLPLKLKLTFLKFKLLTSDFVKSN